MEESFAVSRFFAKFTKVYSAKFFNIFHPRNKTNSVDHDTISIRSIHLNMFFFTGGGLVLFDKMNFETKHIGVQPKKHNAYKKACISIELNPQNTLKFHCISKTQPAICRNFNPFAKTIEYSNRERKKPKRKGKSSSQNERHSPQLLVILDVIILRK